MLTGELCEDTMNLPTYVYEKVLKSRGLSKRFWSLNRSLIIKLLGDPECTMRIHGKLLKLPLSHSLPLYLKEFPTYDRLPTRLSEFIHREYGYLKCVDVGANIGDSIAAFNRHASDAFLAIEPNPNYFKYLQKNFSDMNHIKLLDYYCSSSSRTGVYQIDESSGTASISHSDQGRRIVTKTLDEIISENPEFSDFNMLKIDTDGHDFEVLTGAENIISRNLPIILFECNAFSNSDYVNDCLETLLKLYKNGYSSFVLYDNFGYLIGKLSIVDIRNFRYLLFYQLTSTFYYFDILLMKEDDINTFINSEITYFVDRIPSNFLQQMALSAVNF